MELERLVPDMSRFRWLLRFVKAWAKRQGLYGNIVGFLGGASWAILVAKVCQLEGDCSGPFAPLVLLFFKVTTLSLIVNYSQPQEMSRWPWPAPVHLKTLVYLGGWDPINNPQDREHVMPIITPSFPQVNSTVNVDEENLVIIKARLTEAAEMCSLVFEGSKAWNELLLPSNFFEEFPFYLEVSAWAQCEVLKWFGSVEARLRRLGQMLRNCPAISRAQIWPTSFSTFKKLGGFRRQDWYIGLCFQGESGGTLDSLRESLHIFKDTCESSASQSTSFDLTWRLVHQRQLPLEVHGHPPFEDAMLAPCIPLNERPAQLQTSDYQSPRGNRYYPNSMHWLSHREREPPVASSTPPPTPISRSRSVSISLPLERKAQDPFQSSSAGPLPVNLPRNLCIPIKVPPPPLCDTSTPPPASSMLDFHLTAGLRI